MTKTQEKLKFSENKVCCLLSLITVAVRVRVRLNIGIRICPITIAADYLIAFLDPGWSEPID